MWKYRSAAIFLVALAFAAKAAVLSDVVSLVATALFLGCHYLDRYRSADRVEVKIETKLKAYEAEIEGLKAQISRIGLTMGIRGGNK